MLWGSFSTEFLAEEKIHSTKTTLIIQGNKYFHCRQLKAQKIRVEGVLQLNFPPILHDTDAKSGWKYATMQAN